MAVLSYITREGQNLEEEEKRKVLSVFTFSVFSLFLIKNDNMFHMSLSFTLSCDKQLLLFGSSYLPLHCAEIQSTLLAAEPKLFSSELCHLPKVSPDLGYIALLVLTFFRWLQTKLESKAIQKTSHCSTSLERRHQCLWVLFLGIVLLFHVLVLGRLDLAT